MQPFVDLGLALEARWRAQNYDERAFPELAVAAIEEAQLPSKVTPEEVLTHITRAPVLPEQQDPRSAFGDLAYTCFMAPRFFVSVLFWLDSTTAIHQHGFSGAFQVLSGSSVHSSYRFRETRRVNGRMRLGELTTEAVQLLTVGSVRPIRSGEAFIHSLFHLERPSVTLVVRTQAEADAQPQWGYLPPGVAYDDFTHDRTISKRLEAVNVLLASDPGAGVEAVEAMLADADLELCWALLRVAAGALGASPLQAAYGFERDPQRLAALFELARGRHGEAVDRLQLALEQTARRDEIHAMRELVTRPEHRFLLGLLLNVREPARLLELLAVRDAELDPVEAFLRSIDELAATRALGARGNVIKLPGYDLEHRVALGALLRGGGPPQVREALATVAPGESDEELARLAAELIGELQACPLFEGLW